MAADEHEVSDADRADDIEVDPQDVDEREFFTDDRPVPLDEETLIDDRPDYIGEELHNLD